jgi:hypothetical protein
VTSVRRECPTSLQIQLLAMAGGRRIWRCELVTRGQAMAIDRVSSSERSTGRRCGSLAGERLSELSMRSRGVAVWLNDSAAGEPRETSLSAGDESADAGARGRVEQTFEVWFT